MNQHPLYERLCWICRAMMEDHPSIKATHKCNSCGFTVKKGFIVNPKNYISVDEVLMQRARYEDLPKEYQENINTIVPRINSLLQEFFTNNLDCSRRGVSSGYRPASINAAVGGAKKSNHMTCSAVDLQDVDCKLKQWITVEILTKYDLYMEDPASTNTWVHLQWCAPKSGNRVFKP